MSRRRVTLALAMLAVVAVGVIGLVRAVGRDGGGGPGAVPASAAQADWSYVIPAGTGDRLDRGDRIELLPARIDARVGETIRIRNRDERGYVLGPFYVGPRETLTQKFVSPGTFRGACAVHPSGEIVVDVEA